LSGFLDVRYVYSQYLGHFDKLLPAEGTHAIAHETTTRVQVQI
jgi:hypothetical protein